MTCAACAALQRASRLAHEHKPNTSPAAGQYFVVSLDVDG